MNLVLGGSVVTVLMVIAAAALAYLLAQYRVARRERSQPPDYDPYDDDW